MKTKSVKISLLILSGLIILSYAFLSSAQEQSSTSNNIFMDSDQDGLSDEEEKMYGTDPKKSDSDNDSYSDGTEVKSGYNPLKPAPGDRIIPAEIASAPSASQTADAEENLTKEIAQKISTIANASDPDDQEVSLEQIKNIIDESLQNNRPSEEELPLISESDIQIKKQPYSSLPVEKAKEKRKEDFVNYIVAVSYVLSSNSPEPITSDSDLSALATAMTNNFLSAITTNDSGAIDKLSTSGEKMTEQLKTIEVPEELVDMHIKGLRFSGYAMTLKNNLAGASSDPLANIASLSKIQGFLGELMSFASAAGAKFVEYGLESDPVLDNKLQNIGILPQINKAQATTENKASN